jgi:alpha-galactosidase/6-phospho-beta-glucosidase family protein
MWAHLGGAEGNVPNFAVLEYSDPVGEKTNALKKFGWEAKALGACKLNIKMDHREVRV